MHTAITIPHITETTTTSQEQTMVFLCMQTAITTQKPKLHNITGTYYGVSLSASSSKNTTYNQDYTISQEQTMVFICMHTAATTNKKEKNPTKKQHHYTLKT